MFGTYLGTIQYFAFDFAPERFMVCDGSLLEIQQYSALFSLIGNAYGGDGITTFNLPDLRGRTMICTGLNPVINTTYSIGNMGGAETAPLGPQILLEHTHTVNMQIATGQYATTGSPVGAYAADPVESLTQFYSTQPGSAQTLLGAPTATVGPTGTGANFSILSPYLVLNGCIAMSGYYPQRG